jgi:hypothetical protein
MDYWIKDDDYKDRLTGGQKDLVYQIIISLVTGLLAFTAFVVSLPCREHDSDILLIVILDIAPKMALPICCA